MENSQTKKTAKPQGISLIEALIVLSIFAILVAGIWSTAATAYQNDKNRRLVEQAVQVIANVKALYSGQTPSSGFSINAAMAAGIFPPNMIVQTAPPDVRHAWAQTNSVDITNPDDGLMVLTIDNVPAAACVALVSRLAASADVAQKYGIVSLAVNSATLTAPISPADAASKCEENNVVDLSPLFGISSAYAGTTTTTQQTATTDAPSLLSTNTTTEPNMEKMGIVFTVP